VLRILGKGDRVREVPIRHKVREALEDWKNERKDWAGADESPALFLNQRGGRLSAESAHDVITGIAARAGLDEHVTAHVYADPPVKPTSDENVLLRLITVGILSA
jgi:integrase/recombinase XerC